MRPPVALPRNPNGERERVRRRSDHFTLDDKLRAEKARIEAQLARTHLGPQRDLLERKLSQLGIAFQRFKLELLQPK